MDSNRELNCQPRRQWEALPPSSRYFRNSLLISSGWWEQGLRGRYDRPTSRRRSPEATSHSRGFADGVAAPPLWDGNSSDGDISSAIPGGSTQRNRFLGYSREFDGLRLPGAGHE